MRIAVPERDAEHLFTFLHVTTRGDDEPEAYPYVALYYGNVFGRSPQLVRADYLPF